MSLSEEKKVQDDDDELQWKKFYSSFEQKIFLLHNVKVVIEMRLIFKS